MPQFWGMGKKITEGVFLLDKNSLLTRKQTAEILKVSLTTLWSWNKKGILTSFRLGNKVYYLDREVVASLKPMYLSRKEDYHD